MDLLSSRCLVVLIVTYLYRDVTANLLQDDDNLNDDLYTDSDAFLEPADKRLSKFVRIGRGFSSFVRIGKSFPEQGLITSDFVDGFNDGEDVDKRKSAFVRIGRGDEYDDPVKRLSSFVRIGRDYGLDGVEDDGLEDFEESPSKRSGAFIRMGKFPTSALLRNRNGRIHRIVPQPYYRRSGRIGHSSFIRIGKRDTTDALHRMKDQSDQKQYFGSADDYNFKDDEQDENDQSMQGAKRMNKFVQTGRGDKDDYGYEDFNFDGDMIPGQKRMSKFVRIGRDPYADDRARIEDSLEDGLQKRMSKFVRIGKNYNNIEQSYPDKRLSKIVRFGGNKFEFAPAKRMSSFVRIGKSYPENPEKRMSSFVRIGKSYADSPEKRLSSFVRIGKSTDNFEDKDKRMSKFVRIGKNFNDILPAEKRMSNFVRIGKSTDNSEEVKRALSTFVRIGKSPENLEPAPVNPNSFYISQSSDAPGAEKSDSNLKDSEVNTLNSKEFKER